jgi:integrase/recombinase XerD
MKLESDDFIDDINRWYKAYIDNMRALSYSNNTLELYSRVIDSFIEYSLQYQDEMKLIEIKSIYITSYLAYLENEAKLNGRKVKNNNYLSKSTKQTYLKAIKGLFTFISDNNDELYTFERFFKNIKISDSSKVEEKLVYLSEHEIGLLVNQLEKDKRTKGDYGSYRDSLLVKLMLYGGLRISEALGVRLENFKDSHGDMYSIDIYGKGGKEQIAYIGKKTIEDDLDYFMNIERLSNKDLIMKTDGNLPLRRDNALTIVNRIYKRAGVMKTGLHILRHTLAMRLTKRDVNPVVIKKILRHSNLNTTAIYAKATEESVEKALCPIFSNSGGEK